MRLVVPSRARPGRVGRDWLSSVAAGRGASRPPASSHPVSRPARSCRAAVSRGRPRPWPCRRRKSGRARQVQIRSVPSILDFRCPMRNEESSGIRVSEIPDRPSGIASPESPSCLRGPAVTPTVRARAGFRPGPGPGAPRRRTTRLGRRLTGAAALVGPHSPDPEADVVNRRPRRSPSATPPKGPACETRPTPPTAPDGTLSRSTPLAAPHPVGSDGTPARPPPRSRHPPAPAGPRTARIPAR